MFIKIVQVLSKIFTKHAPDALPTQKGINGYFLVQRYCFTVIGIDPTSLQRTMFNRYLTWIPVLGIVTLCGPIAMLASKYTDNFARMTNVLGPLFQFVLAIAKFFLFLWNKKKIVRLVRDLWLLNVAAKDKEMKILVEENRYDRLISLLYFGMAAISVSLGILSPFLVAGFYAWKGFSFWSSLDLPFKAAYFWNPHSSIFAYIFAFAWNIIGLHNAAHASLGVDTLFSWIMRNICAQFRILNLRFKALASRTKGHSWRQVKYTDAEFAKSIIECVKRHRQCIDLARRFDGSYQHIVFVEFVINCVQIPCLTFQFSQGGELAEKLFSASFLVTVATQLMLYSLGGQRIMDVSSSVDSSIYETIKWHELSVKSKKLLLLPMMRAQRPCKMLGVFFVADLSLFLWVVRTAGSFLTMMLSMDREAT